MSSAKRDRFLEPRMRQQHVAVGVSPRNAHAHITSRERGGSKVGFACAAFAAGAWLGGCFPQLTLGATCFRGFAAWCWLSLSALGFPPSAFAPPYPSAPVSCKIPPMPASQTTASTGPPIRALIVDNDEAHAETMADSLTRVGYAVHGRHDRGRRVRTAGKRRLSKSWSAISRCPTSAG